MWIAIMFTHVRDYWMPFCFIRCAMYLIVGVQTLPYRSDIMEFSLTSHVKSNYIYSHSYTLRQTVLYIVIDSCNIDCTMNLANIR